VNDYISYQYLRNVGITKPHTRGFELWKANDELAHCSNVGVYFYSLRHDDDDDDAEVEIPDGDWLTRKISRDKLSSPPRWPFDSQVSRICLNVKKSRSIPLVIKAVSSWNFIVSIATFCIISIHGLLCNTIDFFLCLWKPEILRIRNDMRKLNITESKWWIYWFYLFSDYFPF